MDRHLIQQTSTSVAPDSEYVRAVARALGIEGEFIPLHHAVPAKKPALLPEPNKEDDKGQHGPVVDGEVLDILP